MVAYRATPACARPPVETLSRVAACYGMHLKTRQADRNIRISEGGSSRDYWRVEILLESWRTDSCRRRTSVPINVLGRSPGLFRPPFRGWSKKAEPRIEQPGLFRPPFRGWSKKAEQPLLGSELCFRVASCRFAATRKKRSPTAFFGGTPKKLKNETIRSTSMSPIRKRNYVLATVFDGGVKDRRSEKKKRKLYVFKMYGRSTGYLPTYLRFCSLKYLSTD